jgi:pilus assembly protein CpaE
MENAGGEKPIRIVISEANPGSADQLRQMLMRLVVGGGKVSIAGYARDGLEVAQMAVHMQPDLMFIDTEMPGIDGFEACKLAIAANPDTICALVADNVTPELVQASMRAGARALLDLAKPESYLRELVEELVELRQTKEKPEFALATDPEKMPVSIAVTAAKGGIGKTTVATNLAVLLAKRFPDQVVLVDFFGQFGNVALSLDLRPSFSIQDLLGYEELDVELVEGHLAHHDTGLKVLPGVSRGDQEALADVDIPQLASLLGMLRRKNRFNVFDLPALLFPASPYVLSRCQHIIVLTTLDDIVTIPDTAALTELIFKSNVPVERIKLVANRVHKANDFTIQNVEEATGMKVWAQLPNEYTVVSKARNEGIPFVVSRPRDAISQALAELAKRIVAESTPQQIAGTNE